MAKIVLQGTVKETRRRGRQKKRWEDNIKNGEELDLDIPGGQRKTEKYIENDGCNDICGAFRVMGPI